jgi:hypothetical protein
MNWGDPLASEILPVLQRTSLDMPNIAGNVGNVLSDRYDNLMRMGLGPEAFQGTLNDLVSRNMLQSTEAGDALSRTAVPLIRDIGDKAYDAALQTELAKMQVPVNLANIAGLGQVSKGGATGSSVSEQSDPLAPYKLMTDIINGPQMV